MCVRVYNVLHISFHIYVYDVFEISKCTGSFFSGLDMLSLKDVLLHSVLVLTIEVLIDQQLKLPFLKRCSP